MRKGRRKLYYSQYSTLSAEEREFLVGTDLESLILKSDSWRKKEKDVSICSEKDRLSGSIVQQHKWSHLCWHFPVKFHLSWRKLLLTFCHHVACESLFKNSSLFSLSSSIFSDKFQEVVRCCQSDAIFKPKVKICIKDITLKVCIQILPWSVTSVYDFFFTFASLPGNGNRPERRMFIFSLAICKEGPLSF